MPFPLEQFLLEYDTEKFPVKIGDRELHFLKPRTIDRFINPYDPMADFPMWAKFWEASVVLTQYIAGLPVDPRRRILELGSGLGVAGMVAAAMGHTITLTEHNSDALNFLQANASLNGLDPIMIRRLDWLRPELDERFDLIIGSEIVYQESVIDALEALFNKYLAPMGRVVLAGRVRTTETLFFERLSAGFSIRASKHTLRSEDQSATVVLFELCRKTVSQ